MKIIKFYLARQMGDSILCLKVIKMNFVCVIIVNVNEFMSEMLMNL